MTKAKCAEIIMANTDKYKKSHLAKMHIAELEQLAAQYSPSEVPVAATEATCAEPEDLDHATTLGAVESAQEKPVAPLTAEAVEQAYDDNAKLVKGPRMDKDEFRATAIEMTLARLGAEADAATIREAVISVINELLEDKVAFCPINDIERLMLATIPQLSDFSGADSVMDGKSFLAKVQEIHGVSVATSRALMVSLMRKRFYQIIGKKSGQKKTTIRLQRRGIRYLVRNGLLVEA